jgi:hypothetical protein
VQIDPDTLPEDPATLQQMLRVLLHQQGELNAENDKLRLLIQRLTRQQFGRRSEQLIGGQLQFVWRIWNKPSPKTRRDRMQRSQQRRASLPVPNARPATRVRCLPTCRTMSWSSMQHPSDARAAAARCTASANSAPSSSTSCRTSCACG